MTVNCPLLSKWTAEPRSKPRLFRWRIPNPLDRCWSGWSSSIICRKSVSRSLGIWTKTPFYDNSGCWQITQTYLELTSTLSWPKMQRDKEATSMHYLAISLYFIICTSRTSETSKHFSLYLIKPIRNTVCHFRTLIRSIWDSTASCIFPPAELVYSVEWIYFTDCHYFLPARLIYSSPTLQAPISSLPVLWQQQASVSNTPFLMWLPHRGLMQIIKCPVSVRKHPKSKSTKNGSARKFSALRCGASIC